MKNLNVSNFDGVKNQFRITTNKGVFFQSYDSIIIFIDKKTGQVFLDPNYYKYSLTTSKYVNRFLDEDSKSLQEKIKSGIYKFKNLNK